MQQDRDLSQRMGLREQYAAATGWLGLACQVLEASVAVFLRRRFGRRYLGGQAAAVLLLVPLWSLGWQEHDPTPLWWFLGLYLLACLWARIETGWRVWRGRDTEHSYFSGESGVRRMRIFGRASEETAKGVVEPLFVMLAGCLLMPTSEPLGAYLIIAGIGLIGSVRMAKAYEQQRLLDLRDAYLSQRAMAERFRRGDWQ